MIISNVTLSSPQYADNWSSRNQPDVMHGFLLDHPGSPASHVSPPSSLMSGEKGCYIHSGSEWSMGKYFARVSSRVRGEHNVVSKHWPDIHIFGSLSSRVKISILLPWTRCFQSDSFFLTLKASTFAMQTLLYQICFAWAGLGQSNSWNIFQTVSKERRWKF